MAAVRRVALLIDTSTSWSSRVIRGVAAYAREHGPWLFFLEPRGKAESAGLPDDWGGDGVIARVTTAQLAADLSQRCVPVVNTSWFDFPAPSISNCTADESAGGPMAAEHLLDRGLKHFAYVGPADRPGYRDGLESSFATALAKRGFVCLRFAHPHRTAGRARWRAELEAMAAWLSKLPKPVGLFAWSDQIGRQVTEAARQAGLRVPQDVAVLGGEFDELMNALSEPPLSSIDWATERVGVAAAEMLDKLMSSGKKSAKPNLIAPLGIVTRHSTDMLAVEDPGLRLAMEFIRSHAHEPISVTEIAEVASVSRRGLEQRFARLLGRSPSDELRRVRLERGRQLLSDTTAKVTEIATRCGFIHGEVFNRAFQRQYGLTPSKYRAHARGI